MSGWYGRKEYEMVIHHYGEEAQKKKIVEELLEFRKEILKDIIGQGDRQLIKEEMADVMNVLVQAQIIYGFSGYELSEAMDTKMERTFDRIMKELEDRKNG